MHRTLQKSAPGSVAATLGIAPGGAAIGDRGSRGPGARPGGTLTAVNAPWQTSMVVASGRRTVYTGGHSSSALSRSTVPLTTRPASSGCSVMTSDPEGR